MNSLLESAFLINDRLDAAVDTDPITMPAVANFVTAVFLAQRISGSGSIACQLQRQLPSEEWEDLDDGYFPWPGGESDKNNGQCHISAEWITGVPVRAHITTSAPGVTFDVALVLVYEPKYARATAPIGQTQTSGT
jgi:hypothetical protein